MNIADDFREGRRVATPIWLVNSPDFRATRATLAKVRVNGEDTPPIVDWNTVQGHRGLNQQGKEAASLMGPPEETATAPVMCLNKALELPGGTMLFMVVESQRTLEDLGVAQAIANLRDPFMSDRRTLVVLGRNLKMPPLVAEDVPVLWEDLPDTGEITSIVAKLIVTANEKIAAKDPTAKPVPVADGDLERSASLLRGLNRFAIGEGFSRHLHRSGIDFAGLAENRRGVIEEGTGRALLFDRGDESFADIGGLNQIKKFAMRLAQGGMPPTALVRIEEIEKAMAGANPGASGDSGVSADQLGVLLTEMEDNGWAGLIAVGPPGSGKSLLSKAMGKAFRAPSLSLDMGAMKSSLVGSSEAKMRQTMSVLKGFAGRGAFFVATSNKLDVIPPELRRRFRYGIWMTDLPTEEERASIWKLHMARCGIPAGTQRPSDVGFTGADIRNVCELASKDRLNCSLMEASEYIVPVFRSDPDGIAKLRAAADGKYLNASAPGAYQKPAVKEGRQLSI